MFSCLLTFRNQIQVRLLLLRVRLSARGRRAKWGAVAVVLPIMSACLCRMPSCQHFCRWDGRKRFDYNTDAEMRSRPGLCNRQLDPFLTLAYIDLTMHMHVSIMYYAQRVCG